MTKETFKSILAIGETIGVEFKRCGNGIEHDVYETVCSFLNRFGGDIFLGVLDNGKVTGVSKKASADMIKNFISVISNPDVFSPTVYLQPESMSYEGHTVIHVHVPQSSEVHSYKKVIYDRVADADVKVTATSQIAAMYIRKQNIFTEKKIFPYLKKDELRLDLLPRIRQMAVNHASGVHPWKEMDDETLLRSAGLYGIDHTTGESGYNLAAVMLLGRDEVIQDISPSYVTDALLRKVNVDRYDDREIVKTNLVESYDQLMNFARKHLPDKFFLEGDIRRNLRDIICREMLVNTLIHREMTGSFRAKFVIESDRMYVDNASRAAGNGLITPENMEPNPKNPIIAGFFHNIGHSDQLGSGVRNLYTYTRFYSGQEPELIEGDVFRIVVPLDEEYSFDRESGSDTTPITTPITTPKITQKTAPKSSRKTAQKAAKKAGQRGKKGTGQKITQEITQEITKKTTPMTTPMTTPIATTIVADKLPLKLTDTEEKILREIRKNPKITRAELATIVGVSVNGIRYATKSLKRKGVLGRTGSNRSGMWIINRK